MNKPTATHINYYHLCHRKLWLFGNGIQMEHNSDLVAMGKLIHESAYPQRSNKYKELDLGFVKIDHYDAQNKVVHEVKKSNKLEAAHEAQVKYYLYILHEIGISGATGLLEYPKLRKTKKVTLITQEHTKIGEWIAAINNIISMEKCPEIIKKPYCKSCAYYEYCFV